MLPALARVAGGATRGLEKTLGAAAEGVKKGAKAVGDGLEGAFSSPDESIKGMGIFGAAGRERAHSRRTQTLKETSKPSVDKNQSVDMLLGLAVRYLSNIEKTLKSQMAFQMSAARRQNIESREESIEEVSKPSAFNNEQKTKEPDSKGWFEKAKSIFKWAIAGLGIGALIIGGMSDEERAKLQEDVDAFKLEIENFSTRISRLFELVQQAIRAMEGAVDSFYKWQDEQLAKSEGSVVKQVFNRGTLGAGLYYARKAGYLGGPTEHDNKIRSMAGLEPLSKESLTSTKQVESNKEESKSSSGRNFQLNNQDIVDLKKTVATEWVEWAGEDQAKGVIDTILNRWASGKWGSRIADVVNAKNQFSDVNGPPARQKGRNNVNQIPMSRVSKAVHKIVDEYLKQRAGGQKSIIGSHLNYANPYYSDAKNLKWINKLQGPRIGKNKAIHIHGTTSDLERYRPKDYSISLPGQSGSAQQIPSEPQSSISETTQPTPIPYKSTSDSFIDKANDNFKWIVEKMISGVKRVSSFDKNTDYKPFVQTKDTKLKSMDELSQKAVMEKIVGATKKKLSTDLAVPRSRFGHIVKDLNNGTLDVINPNYKLGSDSVINDYLQFFGFGR